MAHQSAKGAANRIDMAQLPALIEVLEAFHPQDAAAIRYAAKTLRLAGEMTPGTGGRGAAPMTSSDAVNLLLALNLANTPSDYVDAVKAVADLRFANRVVAPGDRPAIVQAVLQADCLVDVLILLVERGDQLALPSDATDVDWTGRDAVALGDHPRVDLEIVHLLHGFLAEVRFRWSTKAHVHDARFHFRSVGTNAQPQGRWRLTHFDEALFWALKRTVDDVPRWAWPGARGRR